jgi:N,N-dimethylformamidase
MDKLIRSDMVYFETPGGGAVFAVGSITFCGSLLHNNCDNNISKIINNVLTRFRTA